VEKAKQFYRADLSANVWWPSELPEEKLIELYGN
jgi:ribose transport system substrate-binding protein